MLNSLRRARVLVLCGPLALGLLISDSAHAQDTPAASTSWTTFRGDAQRTGSSNAQITLPLSLNWRYTSDAAAGTYSASPLVLDSPSGQRVYFAMGRKVMCVDGQTGSPASGWNAPEISSTISAPLTLLSGDDGDLIISAAQGGAVTAFRSNDGGRAWEVQVQGGVSSGGPVVVQTPAGPRVVVASNGGQIVGITPAGQIDAKWKIPLGRFGTPPATSMALSENGSILCVIATDGKMYGIDVKMGRMAWSVTLANATGVSPIIAGSNVVTAGLTRIASYEASGGANKWAVPSRGTVVGAPAYKVVDGTPMLFYGTTEGNFYALNARDGAQEWKAEGVASFTGAPVVLDNMVLVGTRTGSMVAMNPKSGAVLWQYRLKTERLVTNQNTRGGGGRGGGGFRGASTGNSVPMATIQMVQDGGRGGWGGGGRGGFGGGRTSRTQEFSRAYGISAPPAVVNGQIFVQSDNAAMYSFTSQSIDADAPRVVEPSISVPDAQDQLTALLVGGNNSPTVPGRGPFYFAAQLDDVGSGIDPKTIKVTVDGAPLDPKNVEFDLASGVLTVTLIDPAKGGTNYGDGQKSIGINVSDYAGNVQAAQFNFNVDNTAAPPTAQRDTRNRWGGRNRGGGFPGGPDGPGFDGGDGGPGFDGGDGGPGFDGGDGGPGFDGGDGGPGFDGGEGGPGFGGPGFGPGDGGPDGGGDDGGPGFDGGDGFDR